MLQINVQSDIPKTHPEGDLEGERDLLSIIRV